MPLPDFTEEERAELVRVVRTAIDGDKYLMSPRVRRLKSILAKIDPASAKPVVAHHPPPRPSREPSLLYAKLRGSRRRR
jgi:hypothetical protein